MTSVRMKFRPSSVPDRMGRIYYQVIHNGSTGHIISRSRIYPEEWDGGGFAPEESLAPERAAMIRETAASCDCDMRRIREIIAMLDARGAPYGVAEIRSVFMTGGGARSLCGFTCELTASFRAEGKARLSETYSSALNSFMRFRNGRDILFDEMDAALMEAYAQHLRARGLSMNTISFYFRILRAIYNRAVSRGVTPQNYPFKTVYTGMARTVKRAVPLDVIRLIRDMPLPDRSNLRFSRDMFMFSFFTRGMSFVDMAYLKKSDLCNGILSYRRRKTGQRLWIRWEPCMQEIVDRYAVKSSEYLLPIIRRPRDDDRKQYKSALFNVNRKLRHIGRLAGLPQPLTMYVARHSWATIARDRHLPIPVISEGLGHDSDKTTLIYLASIDRGEVDDANRMILEML